jgi:hypothetical protein
MYQDRLDLLDFIRFLELGKSGSRLEPSFSSLTGLSAIFSSSALIKKLCRNFGSSKAIAREVPTKMVPIA